jgi:hypothetical protein
MGHIMRVDLCVSFIAGLLQAGRAHYAIFNVFIVLRTILHNKNTAKKISASKRFGEIECGNRGQTQQGNKPKDLRVTKLSSILSLQVARIDNGTSCLLFLYSSTIIRFPSRPRC